MEKLRFKFKQKHCVFQLNSKNLLNLFNKKNHEDDEKSFNPFFPINSWLQLNQHSFYTG
uniref:Uncharacterized protein n=1 Tax=Tetranychus urticae TaxID=32264 RepID=T1K194_TETUR